MRYKLQQWWPISWALIEKSTVETYLAVFHVLNSVHGIMHKPNKIVLSYFETQLGDSIDLFFPSSTIICTMVSLKYKNIFIKMI